MSFKMMWAPVLGMAMALGACTGRDSKQIQVEEGEGTGAQAAQPGGAKTTPVAEQPVDGTETETGAAPGGTETASIVLDEADFASYAAKQLRYEFNYLTYKDRGDIKFTNGKATLTFKGLPAYQSGTATLDILDGVEKLMHGEAKGVKLVKGQNNALKMQLSNVNGGGSGAGGTGDLTVDLSVNGGGSGGSGDIDTDTDTDTDTGTGTGGTGGSGGGVDPIAGWDGKSFKGNARWTIVPIE
jgi:hypothetical protein